MDMLKIVTALAQINTNEDSRYNSIGEEFLAIGKKDGQIGVVDENGNVDIVGSPVTIERNGNNGQITLNANGEKIQIKWGRFFADSGAGSGVTNETISFDKPFENDCSIISVTQISNDAIRNIMATPAKSSFNLSFEGGKNNEELAYFAIGY